MAELWGGLSRNLSLLDRLAADPDSLTADDAGARLQRLQYSLHTASEEAYGLDPPGDTIGTPLASSSGAYGLRTCPPSEL